MTAGKHAYCWCPTRRQRGGGGPRLLLVHGFGVGSFQYFPLMDRLADEHQVWALDLMGQGLSWPSEQALAGVPAPALAMPASPVLPAALSFPSCCHGLCEIDLKRLSCS